MSLDGTSRDIQEWFYSVFMNRLFVFFFLSTRLVPEVWRWCYKRDSHTYSTPYEKEWSTSNLLKRSVGRLKCLRTYFSDPKRCAIGVSDLGMICDVFKPVNKPTIGIEKNKSNQVTGLLSYHLNRYHALISFMIRKKDCLFAEHLIILSINL